MKTISDLNMLTVIPDYTGIVVQERGAILKVNMTVAWTTEENRYREADIRIMMENFERKVLIWPYLFDIYKSVRLNKF